MNNWIVPVCVGIGFDNITLIIILSRPGLAFCRQKPIFARDSGKNRFLPVFAGFFQNLVKSFKSKIFSNYCSIYMIYYV